MEALILVFDHPAPVLSELRGALSHVGAVTEGPGQLIITRDDERSYLRVLEDSGDEVFEDWPPELVPDNPGLFALDYRGTDLASAVVCALARSHRFLVDTNFGEVLSSDDFVELATSESSWTWEAWP